MILGLEIIIVMIAAGCVGMVGFLLLDERRRS